MEIGSYPLRVAAFFIQKIKGGQDDEGILECGTVCIYGSRGMARLFLGGCDGLLYALLAFVVIDYITGVMCAISDQKLSSAVGFKGICRKVLIFLMVGIANIMDVHVIGTGSVLRTAAIFFYISNEGISLLENASHLGLPVPAKIKAVLEQLHDRAEDDKDNGEG